MAVYYYKVDGQEKNKKQIRGAYHDLKKLAEVFPGHKVIVGCDANNPDLDPSEMSTKESEY